MRQGCHRLSFMQEICRQWPRCTSDEITNGLKAYFTRDTFTADDIVKERGKMMEILGGLK